MVSTKGQMAAFETLRDAVQHAMVSRSTPTHSGTASTLSPTELLAQLAQLHAAGIITDNEFSAKEREIFERM